MKMSDRLHALTMVQERIPFALWLWATTEEIAFQWPQQEKNLPLQIVATGFWLKKYGYASV